MLHVVPAFSRIGEENAFAVLARAQALIAQGRDVINLGIGQPDMPTPAHVVEAGIKALRDGHHVACTDDVTDAGTSWARRFSARPCPASAQRSRTDGRPPHH